MINYNTVGNKLKVNIINFSKKISTNFTKPTQKFISDMIFGIIAAKSCQINEISRELKESIELKKTAERLGRNISGFSENETLMQNYLDAAKSSLSSDAMILIDASDVTKSCSPKMEAIGSVRDGSTGKFAPGYWTIEAVALSDNNQQPIPVYENLYPCTKKGGIGFKAETKKCLQNLRENFDNSFVRVLDRGFDTGDIITEFSDNNEMFILRVNQNRKAVHKGKESKINDIVRGLACESEFTFHSKCGKVSRCKVGMTQIVLQNPKNTRLNLVVCKEFGENNLVLYTNLSETLESIAVRVVKAYLMRWRIEEYFAFKKQGLKFEEFRVRSLNAIKTLALLVTIAAGYIAMLCDETKSKTMVELIGASKRIVKTSVFLKKKKFLLYAVLDGINNVFATLRCGISHYFTTSPHDNQLCFHGL